MSYWVCLVLPQEGVPWAPTSTPPGHSRPDVGPALPCWRWGWPKRSRFCRGELGNPWWQGLGLLGLDRMGFALLSIQGGPGLPGWEGQCRESSVHGSQRLGGQGLSLGIRAQKPMREVL